MIPHSESPESRDFVGQRVRVCAQLAQLRYCRCRSWVHTSHNGALLDIWIEARLYLSRLHVFLLLGPSGEFILDCRLLIIT